MTRQLIEVRGGPGGRSAFIKGTRVRVSDIAQLEGLRNGSSAPEQICKALPHLTPEQVRAALEYWRAHPKDIQKEIEEEEALLGEMAEQG